MASFSLDDSISYLKKGLAELIREKDLRAPGGGKFDWTTYYAVITHLDEAVGRLMRGLEEARQLGNTVVFFLGDNGYMANTRSWTGKVRHWDESVRVPYFGSGAGVKKGVRTEDPVASIDLTATWLELAGQKAARAECLAAGVSIEPYRLVGTNRHKLVVFASKQQALYDCVVDAGENNNLIDEPRQAKLREQLRAKLRARMRETGDHAIAWMSS